MFFLIILTISAFSAGETLQAITVSQVFASWMKISCVFLIPFKAVDSIIKALLTCYFLSSSFNVKLFGVKKSIACYSLCISQICIDGQSKEHEKPIFHAVSSLSPVSIQTLIWASRNAYIVWGTFSYNLSSTVVAPIRIKSFSNSS